MAKIQQPMMTFLALDNVQMNLDLIGWQMAIYRSTVKAVNERAKIPKKEIAHDSCFFIHTYRQQIVYIPIRTNYESGDLKNGQCKYGLIFRIQVRLSGFPTIKNADTKFCYLRRLFQDIEGKSLVCILQIPRPTDVPKCDNLGFLAALMTPKLLCPPQLN